MAVDAHTHPDRPADTRTHLLIDAGAPGAGGSPLAPSIVTGDGDGCIDPGGGSPPALSVERGGACMPSADASGIDQPIDWWWGFNQACRSPPRRTL